MIRARLGLAAAIAAALIAGEAAARDQIRIVGSSTVFPFTTAVAEQFGKSSGGSTPIVESTGTGGGMKLFCAGMGADHPDAVNASRPMKKSEYELCAKNGVTDIIQITVGYDGIVVANAKDAPAFDLSTTDLYKALAKNQIGLGQITDNKAKMWNEVNSALPAEKIEVLGPPPSSGTRDAFAELALDGGAKTIAGAKELGITGAKAMEVRTDGSWVDAGENDNIIVSKLTANPGAVGVFGFSFLEENADKIKAAKINGVEPSVEAIADGSYPLSRELYVYVKKGHIGAIKGLDAFIGEYVSDSAMGEDGYLADKGLIPLPADKLTAQQAVAKEMKLIDPAQLH